MIFFILMSNNQTNCGIIYEEIAMRASDDKRMINYDWSYKTLILNTYWFCWPPRNWSVKDQNLRVFYPSKWSGSNLTCSHSFLFFTLYVRSFKVTILLSHVFWTITVAVALGYLGYLKNVFVLFTLCVTEVKGIKRCFCLNCSNLEDVAALFMF